MSISAFSRFKRAMGFNPVVWATSVPRMRRQVLSFRSCADGETGSGPRMVVLVMPWLGSAVPWFAISLGLMLAAEGAKVTFVLDSSRFGSHKFRHRVILSAIKRVLKVVAERHEVINLDDEPCDGPALEPGIAASLGRMNATWELRGEGVNGRRTLLEAMGARQIAKAYPRARAFLENHPPEVVVLPSGLYGISAAWREAASGAGVRVATYDTAGYETGMIAANGLACHLADVPMAFQMILKSVDENDVEEDLVMSLANDEMRKRSQGSDAFESQIRGGGSGGDELNGGILVALNSSWDGAALGLHRVFKDNTDWIVSTVDYLLQNTDAPVIVRQHPAERLAFARTTDNYNDMLVEAFGHNPRLHFIAAHDPINSYALLEKALAVVVHSSTIGTEAVAFGKPVVTPSKAYYADLGFVNSARSKSEYEELLKRASAGELKVSQTSRRMARVCFYITQCCNWVPSAFNSADYRIWSRQPLDRWYSQPIVKRMLKSWMTGVPIAALNHRVRAETQV